MVTTCNVILGSVKDQLVVSGFKQKRLAVGRRVMSSLVFPLAPNDHYDCHWQYIASYMCAFIGTNYELATYKQPGSRVSYDHSPLKYHPDDGYKT